MKETIDRIGIIVLDDAQLKTIGRRVVGGNFESSLGLAFGAVTTVGGVVGYCYWLMDPANRRAAWNIFMSNFKRTTVAAVTTAASVAATTAPSAQDDLVAIDAVLDSSASDFNAFMSCLDIIDDNNEL